jgi:hypothetical protein
MATTSTMGYSTIAPSRLRLNRALTVTAATAAVLAVWTVAVPLLGVQLTINFGNGAPQSVGFATVLSAVLVAALCGWGLLAVLERRFARGRTIWTRVAGVALLVSLSFPLSAGATTSAKIVLALMHLTAAGVLIAGLRRGGH